MIYHNRGGRCRPAQKACDFKKVPVLAMLDGASTRVVSRTGMASEPRGASKRAGDVEETIEGTKRARNF